MVATKAKPQKKKSRKPKAVSKKEPSKEKIHLAYFIHSAGITLQALADELGIGNSTMRKATHDAWPVRRPELKQRVVKYLESHAGAKAAWPSYKQAQGLNDIEDLFELAINANASTTGPPKTVITPNPNAHVLEWSNELMLIKTMRHFKLSTDPFVGDIAGIKDIYMTPALQDTADDLYNVATQGGFCALIAESGAGKTMVRRAVEDRLFEEGVVSVVRPKTLNQKMITTKTLLYAITSDLTGQAPPNNKSPEQMARHVERLLIERSDEKKRVLLVIEDAQKVDEDTLCQLKSLLELEVNFKLLIGILLIGQPELGLLLNDKLNYKLRQVSWRCSILTIPTLNGNTYDYLQHKFARAGADIKTIIEKEAVEEIQRAWTTIEQHGHKRVKVSRCFPLTIQRAVTSAMNYAAKTSGSKIVRADDVIGALRSRG